MREYLGIYTHKSKANIYYSSVLNYLRVHPDYEHQDTITSLVTSGINAADRLSLPIYGAVYGHTLGIYQKMGFRKLGEEELNVKTLYKSGRGQLTYMAYAIIRDPRVQG
jgi:hypothetical protein